MAIVELVEHPGVDEFLGWLFIAIGIAGIVRAVVMMVSAYVEYRREKKRAERWLRVLTPLRDALKEIAGEEDL